MSEEEKEKDKNINPEDLQSGNEKAELLSQAMLEASALKLVQSFDFPSMVNDFVSNIDMEKLK